MRVHAVASQSHYGQHIDAVWRHLPDSLRGETRVGEAADARRLPDDDIVMIAGYIDIPRARGRRVIFVEHGAGQTYVGLPDMARSYYSGGPHPDNVVGYLGPRQDVVDRWSKPGFACGSPICDPYELFGEDNTVAITFHWTARRLAAIVPELGSAFDDWVDDIERVVDALHANGYTVLGHRHPRFRHLSSVWETLGVVEVDADEARRRAGILIADNTSFMYEMMYLGRKVVALNSPRYRRHVDHGLRFWEHAPLPQVDDADELVAAIEAGFPDPFGDLMEANMATAGHVYGKPFSDGLDGLRAAVWVSQFVAGI